MMIACPRCGTSYDVEAALFGSRPRVVQCSGCDWRWTQLPPPVLPEAAADESAADPGGGDDLDSWGLPPEPEDEPVEAPVVAAPAAPAAEDPSAEAAESPSVPPPDDDPVEGGEEVAEEAWEEPEDAIEPAEPAPAGTTAPAASAPAGKRRFALPRGRGFVAGTTAAATVIALASLLVVLREPIMALMPATNGFYSMLGLAHDPLGAGLEIRDISSLREREGGEDVLTVSGVVANVAAHPAPLPRLRVSLYDANDEELQFVTVPSERPSLQPGETIPFDARIADPRPEARRVRVGFAPPPSS